MTSRLDPYINFKGNAKEAMEFYKTIFGGKLDMDTYGKFPMPDMDESESDKIMHAMLEAENGITFMASDTPKGWEEKNPGSVSMALSGDNEEELKGYFEKLSEEGTITAPLEVAPWGDSFGMVVDKFGITWMVNIAGKKETE